MSDHLRTSEDARSDDDRLPPVRPAIADPVSRWLVYASLVAAAAVLALLAYAIYAAVAGPRAPRTALERDIMALESIVVHNPGSPHAWGDYIKSLVIAGRYGEAARVVEDARSEVGTATAVHIEEARLYLARGKEDRALELLERATAQAKVEMEAQRAAQMAKGVSVAPDTTDIIAANILKAEVYEKLGMWREVVDAYTAALDHSGSMADVLSSRGEAYLELGDVTNARADFERALEFIPDYGPALEGLKRSGSK